MRAADSTPPPDARRHALVARSLYRFFRTGDEEVLALQGVSMTVEAGELVAVTGPSGSGKSTLLACLAGLDEPDGGSVSLGGVRMSHRPESTRARMRARGIGVLTQNGNLLAHLSVAGNVMVARRLAGSRGPTVDELVAQVGLAAQARALPSTLSGGEAARAGLAVGLAGAPAVVIADEPTGELDSVSEDGVLRLLSDAADRGAAVVVASHSAAVTAAADRTIRLADGRVVA